MFPQIIALGHCKGVGKDTVGKILCELMPEYSCYSLASPIKEFAYQIFKFYGIREPAYYEQYPEKKDVVIPELRTTPRDVYIRLGTDFARIICEDIWLRHIPQNRKIVITDCRFGNEVMYVKRCGGLIAKVERQGYNVPNDNVDAELSKFNGWDYIIKNNGSMEELEKEVKEFVLWLNKK